jgi:polyhydroxyalkanoate synthesis repressor PhaR
VGRADARCGTIAVDASRRGKTAGGNARRPAKPDGELQPMNETTAKRVIKKYPNRRLYDTNESKYVTLSDVRKLVLEETPFCVIDKKTGEDITRNILLQIIIEQEEGGEPMFSTDALQQMIGFYGNSARSLAGDFLRNSVHLFYEQQKKLQDQMTNAMQLNPVSSLFADAAKRNLELWQKMQESFLAGGGLYPKTAKPEPEEP